MNNKINILITMKLIVSFLLSMLLAASLTAQIKITKEYSNISEIEANVEFVDQDVNSETSNGNSTYDSLRKSLRDFDYELLSKFLNKGLCRELDDLKIVLDEQTKIYNSNGKVYFKDNISDGFSAAGTAGYARFRHSNREIGTLEIMYSYWGERPIISQIMIVKNGKVVHEYPKLLKKIKKVKKEIKQLSGNQEYTKVIDLYKMLIDDSKYLEDYYKDPMKGLSEKARFHGNLAGYYALTNDADKVIDHATLGMEIFRYHYWINTKLVLGHVLKSDFEKSIEIYSRDCIRWFDGDLFYRDVFLNDLKQLKNEGIEIEYYDQYISLLEGCKS